MSHRPIMDLPVLTLNHVQGNTKPVSMPYAVRDCPNEFLKYVLVMAINDRLLSDQQYLCRLVNWLKDIDLEAEYMLIMAREAGHGKGSSLSAAMRRRVKGLVEYARAKERIGPGEAGKESEEMQTKGLLK